MTTTPPDETDVAALLAAIRYTDVRFLLPELARTAGLVGEPKSLVASALERAGLQVLPATPLPHQPDLAVAGPAQIALAIQSAAAAVLVDGPRGARLLRAAGYEITRLMFRPCRDDPSLVILP